MVEIQWGYGLCDQEPEEWRLLAILHESASVKAPPEGTKDHPIWYRHRTRSVGRRPGPWTVVKP